MRAWSRNFFLSALGILVGSPTVAMSLARTSASVVRAAPFGSGTFETCEACTLALAAALGVVAGVTLGRSKPSGLGGSGAAGVPAGFAAAILAAGRGGLGMDPLAVSCETGFDAGAVDAGGGVLALQGVASGCEVVLAPASLVAEDTGLVLAGGVDLGVLAAGTPVEESRLAGDGLTEARLRLIPHRAGAVVNGLTV